MAEFSVPDTALAQVHRWCAKQVPERVRDNVRIECEVDGRDVTIVESHAPTALGSGTDWMRSPVAQLRYMKSRRIWRLYWIDSNDRWHEYPDLLWAHDVRELLAEIERDPTALFWG